MEILGKDSVKDHSTHRIAARLAVVSTVVATLLGSYGVVAAGASVDVGVATIIDPANGQALASGSAAKLFTVTLPQFAACAGDTAGGGYHVYSFLVQPGTDVSTLTFLPNPSVGYGLVTFGGYYGPANTAAATGEIIDIPTDFQWNRLTAGTGLELSSLLYSGTSGVWETGLACVNASGHVSSYWTTEVTFTASHSDSCGFTWAAVPGVPTGTPEAPLPILLPVIGIAIVSGAITIGRRRSRRAIVPVHSTP